MGTTSTVGRTSGAGAARGVPMASSIGVLELAASGGVGMAVYWHGTRQEASELLFAISAHCSCDPSPDPPTGAPRPGRCPPHRMLVEDQRAVNGLLFVRKIVGQLLLEEWDLTATGWANADRPPRPATWPADPSAAVHPPLA